ncbi:MAG: organic solvent tolerance protein OstA, partial [Thermoguttaceae bacterium]|nr:organic solvent tolerance protein OstA [Thermoguttaceae bacterium]
LGCLGDGWLLTAQAGTSSDRNFIPQYFEKEWQTNSNPETRFELKNTYNNQALGITGAIRTDDFYTQTNWLPRLDHYWLGEPLFGSNLIWYEHTRLGYGQFKTTDIPYADEDKALFRYLDWELAPDSTSNSPYSPGTRTLSADGLVFTSRHELDAPFQLGPVKATPYALGEYGFWSQGVSDSDVGRLYGRLGLRLNLPVWKVDSNVESRTWYLNGLAHKMNFTVDASVSDADQNYDDLVLYDQIDDWQIQEFRRRYSVTTFDGSIPLRFDERYYAIRQGLLAGNVTSPSPELADDLQLVRLGWNNRWQTKRGPAGNRRVVDWIKFDAGLNLYPNDEENFGEIPGLLDYDASWLVGDRFAVLSSGLYDVWGTGQKITRVGFQRRRPGLSSVYLGVDRLYGPIDSTYLNFAVAYRTSEKWGIGFNASYDLSEGHNIGQNLTVSRVGESFVVTVEASRTESQDNWGLNLQIEPIFLFDLDKGDEGLLGLGRMN